MEPICVISSGPWQAFPQSGDTVTPVLQRLGTQQRGQGVSSASNDNELDDLLQLSCKAPGARAVTSEALQSRHTLPRTFPSVTGMSSFQHRQIKFRSWVEGAGVSDFWVLPLCLFQKDLFVCKNGG